MKNFATVTKWNTRIEIPDVVPEVVRKAFKIAETEKPGSVHLELPEDVAAQKVGRTYQTTIPPIRARRSSRGQALSQAGGGALGEILKSGDPRGQRRGAQERGIRSSGNSPNSSAFPW